MMISPTGIIKGIVHPKLKILSLFVYSFFLLLNIQVDILKNAGNLTVLVRVRGMLG